MTRLNSCQVTKTGFFSATGAQKSSETATTTASPPRSKAGKVSIPQAAIADSSSTGEGAKEKSTKLSNSSLQGRWTNEEHRLFLEGIRLFKRDWRSIEKHIGTRTCSQIRSHAQKYYMRLER